jgi:predicted ATP-grasp superfamily ATP-dependent carboligase
VPGEDQTIEVCMFYRSLDGRETRMCTGFKKRQFPPGQGIMAYGETRDLPELAGKSRRFIEDLDYRGLGGIEFKRYRGREYFIEMSTRLEAFHALAVRAGVDLPWYAYSDVVLGRPEGGGDGQCRACYVDEAALLGLLRHHRREVALFREIRPYLFRRNTAFALWDIGDLLPWFFFLAKRVARFVDKSLRVPAGRHRAS